MLEDYESDYSFLQEMYPNAFTSGDGKPGKYYQISGVSVGIQLICPFKISMDYSAQRHGHVLR